MIHHHSGTVLHWMEEAGVTIVGAGPAGLVLALALAQHGVRVGETISQKCTITIAEAGHRLYFLSVNERRQKIQEESISQATQSAFFGVLALVKICLILDTSLDMPCFTDQASKTVHSR
jgi:predicted flavoprotein YhiN